MLPKAYEELLQQFEQLISEETKAYELEMLYKQRYERKQQLRMGITSRLRVIARRLDFYRSFESEHGTDGVPMNLLQTSN